MSKPAQRNPLDVVFSTLTGAASIVVPLLIVGIILILYLQSSLAIERFGVIGFITSSEWDPVRDIFGGAAPLYGTIVTTALALLIAVPAALGIAVFVTEVAPTFLKKPIGIAIELLAAIPSIIYGMWGLFTLAPIMADYVEPAIQSSIGGLPLVGLLFEGTPMGIDVLTASLILSIMIIPFTASISRDTFNLTPPVVKESAYGLGATKWEVIKGVIIPYSKLGIFGGIVLSLGRAIGETMAVAFVLGNNHEIRASLFAAASTVTVTLANEFTEADTDLYLSSLFYLALILFVMSFVTLALAKLFLLRADRSVVR
ncbi:MAG: phosphate ABC transporter permease subunit PstC [Deltaproteobacteria bacterium]|nr:phosphate ABC transporter permease subunit PstC [Deltaproteobacteria bacterium]